MTLRERLARQPPGYEFTIGRILAIYSGLMVALALVGASVVGNLRPLYVSCSPLWPRSRKH